MNRRQLLRLFMATGGWIACGVNPVFAESSDELARRAQDALTGGDTEKALLLLGEAQAKDTRNDRVQALLGRAYFQRGEVRAALEHFSLAVRLNPEDTLSRIMIETISQFPLPPRQEKAGNTPPPRRSPHLAERARAEREALAGRPGQATPRTGPLRLLLDPGHGGTDKGAPGDGLREADVTLDVALRLARILAASPQAVALSLTRTADVTLPGWARTALSGFYGADLLVSLHATRLPEPQATGILVCTHSRTPSDTVAQAAAKIENATFGASPSAVAWGGRDLFMTAAQRAVSHDRLARGEHFAQALFSALPGSGLPIMPHGVAKAPFRLLAEADVPAVLIEMGFLSQAGDAAALGVPDKRQALAQGLATAVLTAIGSG